MFFLVIPIFIFACTDFLNINQQEAEYRNFRHQRYNRIEEAKFMVLTFISSSKKKTFRYFSVFFGIVPLFHLK